MHDWNNSDEDNNFDNQLPPGFHIVAAAEVMDRKIMEAQEMRASIDRFFDSLNVDQLCTFMRMMSLVTSNPQVGHDTAQFWCGASSAMLKYKYKVCGSCGVEHNEAEHFMQPQGGHGGEANT